MVILTIMLVVFMERALRKNPHPANPNAPSGWHEV